MVEIKIVVSDIAYGDIAEKVLPAIIDKMLVKRQGDKLSRILGKFKTLPTSFVKTSLKLLDQDTQDELAVFFLSENKEKLLGLINSFAESNGVTMEISNLEIQKK